MRKLSIILLTVILLAPTAFAALNQAPSGMHYEVRVDEDTINRVIESMKSDMKKAGFKDIEVRFENNLIKIEGAAKKLVWIGFRLHFKLETIRSNTFKMTCKKFQVLGFVPLVKSWVIDGISGALKDNKDMLNPYLSWNTNDDNIVIKVTPPDEAILPDLSLNSCYVGNSGVVFWGKYN